MKNQKGSKEFAAQTYSRRIANYDTYVFKYYAPEITMIMYLL